MNFVNNKNNENYDDNFNNEMSKSFYYGMSIKIAQLSLELPVGFVIDFYRLFTEAKMDFTELVKQPIALALKFNKYKAMYKKNVCIYF